MNRVECKDPAAEPAITNIQKSWSEISEKEIFQIKKDKCRFCKYSTREGRGSENIGAIMCDYIGKTGHSRGCRPDQCNKFKRKTKRGRKKHE